VKVLGPTELAMFTCVYVVEQAMNRLVIGERHYEISSKVCNGIGQLKPDGTR
jgi:hypothetical protein